MDVIIKNLGLLINATLIATPPLLYAALGSCISERSGVVNIGIEGIEEGYELDWFNVHTSNFTTSTSTVCLKKGEEKFESVALGDGPIDAAFKAIDQIVKPQNHAFENFTIHSISEGKDTLGDVIVKLSKDGQYFTGKGLSTDILEASITAYINAINKLCESAAQDQGNEVR